MTHRRNCFVQYWTGEFSTYITAETGHSINEHYSAQKAYHVTQDWMKARFEVRYKCFIISDRFSENDSLNYK